MVDYRLDEYIQNLSKRQPIDWDELRGSIILEIGSGIDALHKAQTNHCALRTSRIYLTANLRPKIGFVGFGTDEHRDGMRYWSPELFDQDIKCVQYSKVYLRTLGLNVKTYKPESLLNSL